MADEYTEFEEKVRARIKARQPMSSEERREQRINFVLGMLPESSELSREQVEEIVDRY